MKWTERRKATVNMFAVATASCVLAVAAPDHILTFLAGAWVGIAVFMALLVWRWDL